MASDSIIGDGLCQSPSERETLERAADLMDERADELENEDELYCAYERRADAAALRALAAEVEGLRRDAKRYRQLRMGSRWPAAFRDHDHPEPLTGDDLDAAIDRAIAGE